MIGRPRGVAAVVAGVVAAGAVVAGLLVLGSPAEERDRRLDTRRVDDLRDLARTVDLQWSRTGTLPARLEALEAPDDGALSTTDPESGRPYEYRTLDAGRFELCAEFANAATISGDRAFWTHPAGRHCYLMEAEPVEREPQTPAPRAPPRPPTR